MCTDSVHVDSALNVFTAALAGNDPFLIKNITQNRKRFITHPRHEILIK